MHSTTNCWMQIVRGGGGGVNIPQNSLLIFHNENRNISGLMRQLLFKRIFSRKIIFVTVSEKLHYDSHVAEQSISGLPSVLLPGWNSAYSVKIITLKVFVQIRIRKILQKYPYHCISNFMSLTSGSSGPTTIEAQGGNPSGPPPPRIFDDVLLCSERFHSEEGALWS